MPSSEPHNWRVFAQVRKCLRFLTPRLLAHMPALPRPAYCARCDSWAWCTAEIPALTTRPQFLCHDCADVNDRESNAAWSAFYE